MVVIINTRHPEIQLLNLSAGQPHPSSNVLRGACQSVCVFQMLAAIDHKVVPLNVEGLFGKKLGDDEQIIHHSQKRF